MDHDKSTAEIRKLKMSILHFDGRTEVLKHLRFLHQSEEYLKMAVKITLDALMTPLYNHVRALALAIHLFNTLAFAQGDPCDAFGTTECSFDGRTGTCTEVDSCLTFIVNAFATDCSCANPVLPSLDRLLTSKNQVCCAPEQFCEFDTGIAEVPRACGVCLANPDPRCGDGWGGRLSCSGPSSLLGQSKMSDMKMSNVALVPMALPVLFRTRMFVRTKRKKFYYPCVFDKLKRQTLHEELCCSQSLTCVYSWFNIDPLHLADFQFPLMRVTLAQSS